MFYITATSRRIQVSYIIVKRKNKTRRIKQASKDYNKNNKNTSNSTEGNKRQSAKEESSPSTSLAQRERTIQETVPEVFDSSESHGRVEVKNSISMQEKDMKEALSITERKQPERTEMVNTETTDNNVNTDLPVINLLTEQQGSLRESKKDEVAKTGIMIPDYKKIQNIESYRKQGNLNCPNIFTTSTSLWQNYTMAWIVTYKEFARNTRRMAEYWYRLFWKPSSAKEEYHQQ